MRGFSDRLVSLKEIPADAGVVFVGMARDWYLDEGGSNFARSLLQWLANGAEQFAGDIGIPGYPAISSDRLSQAPEAVGIEGVDGSVFEGDSVAVAVGS
jgi:hypothetical protein